MRIVYTDESPRLKDLADLVNSKELRSFVKENLRYMQRYIRGTDRVLPNLTKDVLNDIFKAAGFSITDKCDHLHSLSNYSAYYVKDDKTDEYIGLLHLNDDMFGYLYCFASDLKRLPVSDIYCISPRNMTRDRGVDVDWSRYSFEKSQPELSAVDDLLHDAQLRSQNGAAQNHDQTMTGREK